MMGALISEFWPYVVAAIAALITALKLRKGGSDSVKAKTANDAAKRDEAGRTAVVRAKEELSEGKTPEQIVRNNDGAWQ